MLIAKLSSIKKTATCPRSFRARRLSISSSLTTLSLVRKRMESPKNPVTVQNSHPYGQPRPDSTGTRLKDFHPEPCRLVKRRNTPGTRLNCSRSIASQGITGYSFRLGFRSFPLSSTGSYISFSRPCTASATILGQVSSASPSATASACRGPPSWPSASAGSSVTCGPPMTTGMPAARSASAKE